MFLSLRHYTEELKKGEDMLGKRLGRLVNSMREPNWFLEQRRKLDEDRRRQQEELEQRMNDEEAMLIPPSVEPEDINSVRRCRLKTSG